MLNRLILEEKPTKMERMETIINQIMETMPPMAKPLLTLYLPQFRNSCSEEMIDNIIDEVEVILNYIRGTENAI